MQIKKVVFFTALKLLLSSLTPSYPQESSYPTFPSLFSVIHMDRGQNSTRANNNNNSNCYSINEFILPDNMSEISLKTVENIQARRRKGKGLEPGTVSYMRDNKCPGYGWLLPGWLGEERVVASGRVYRHYYDPSGRLYRTQFEVLYAWEKSGLILLDP